MLPTLTPDDESKPVRNADGERVGRVIAVEDGTAAVDPEPGLTETFLSMLGWAEVDAESETYTLQSAAIEEITDEAIRLTEF